MKSQKNPKVEITYLSEEKEKITVNLDDVREKIGIDYSLGKSVEEFGFFFSEDRVEILKIKINDKIVWKRKKK